MCLDVLWMDMVHRRCVLWDQQMIHHTVDTLLNDTRTGVLVLTHTVDPSPPRFINSFLVLEQYVEMHTSQSLQKKIDSTSWTKSRRIAWSTWVLTADALGTRLCHVHNRGSLAHNSPWPHCLWGRLGTAVGISRKACALISNPHNSLVAAFQMSDLVPRIRKECKTLFLFCKHPYHQRCGV